LIADWAGEHAGRRTRFVGEPIWPGRTAAEVDEAIEHEGLINLALGAVPISVLCPYEVGDLPPGVVGGVARTHPALVRGDDHEDSPVYDGAAAALEVGRSPLPALGAPLVERDYGFDDLYALRFLVAEEAGRLGLSQARVEDLVLATSEAATNTVRHAGGRGTLRLWADDRQLVCELADDGLIGDPLAGRRRARQDEDHGRGLWLIHQLCDLVQVRSGPDGTRVRMHIRRDRAAGRA
jgi:anti-sigma regulatory factor (Ser/Thr protein kinase)